MLVIRDIYKSITHASVFKLSFGCFFRISMNYTKKRPNDDLIRLACVFDLVYTNFSYHNIRVR